jgi:SHS2 domain-containing protein
VNQEPGYELVEHTADVKLRARGRSLGETMANAAFGLAALVLEVAPSAAQFERHISVSADDLPSLVVSFLNEVLFVLESEGLVPAQFRDVTVAGCTFSATVKWSRAAGPPVREVKAATYHDLKVGPDLIEVVLDL